MNTGSLNVMRYLTFETSQVCNLTTIHPKCPISHPERYLFGDTTQVLTDDAIVEFWKWCRFSKDFRGIVLLHLYNEPTLNMPRLHIIMDRIKKLDPGQPFHLFTNSSRNHEGFNLIKFTDYDAGAQLDDRILSAHGEGKPYEEVQAVGWCGRGFGWELPIDNCGNWMLCCNDWRNEESVGNIFKDDWETMFKKFEEKGRKIRWNDKESYDALPRMCRACMDVNFNLHRSGGSL